MRDRARGSVGFFRCPRSPWYLGYRVADRLSVSRQSRISMRLALLAAWTHSISHAFARVLLTVLFGANRIRYRRGTLSPLTPRSQPHVVESVRIQASQSVVLGYRYSTMMLFLVQVKMPDALGRDESFLKPLVKTLKSFYLSIFGPFSRMDRAVKRIHCLI